MKYVKRAALDCFTVVACEKRGAFGAFRAMECVNRGAFDCFTVVACINRTAFSCPHVGAYCIRPTNDPPKGGEGPAFGRGQAFAIHGMAFCGAYAIRPYPNGQKMIAVGACHWVRYEKRGAMPAFYRLTWRRSYACDLLL